MQIGRASKQTGASADAIRFYERKGLLRRMPRTDGGFRLYSEEDVATLPFIRRAQRLGFSLVEIRELVLLRSRRRKPCEQVRNMLQRKLARICTRIHELRELERDLRASLRLCNRGLKKRDGRCPVLAVQRASRGQAKS